MKIFWRKLTDEARIPTKRDEDAGFDIYTTTTVRLEPFEKRLLPTGIAAAVSPGYWLMVFDRGSTGSVGLHTHCGVVDNGYRGEIFICLCNDNPFPVIITDEISKYEFKDGIARYPLSKAIAQLIPIAQPQVESQEASSEAWEKLANTERGEGKLGASGK